MYSYLHTHLPYFSASALLWLTLPVFTVSRVVVVPTWHTASCLGIAGNEKKKERKTKQNKKKTDDPPPPPFHFSPGWWRDRFQKPGQEDSLLLYDRGRHGNRETQFSKKKKKNRSVCIVQSPSQYRIYVTSFTLRILWQQEADGHKSMTRERDDGVNNNPGTNYFTSVGCIRIGMGSKRDPYHSKVIIKSMKNNQTT